MECYAFVSISTVASYLMYVSIYVGEHICLLHDLVNEHALCIHEMQQSFLYINKNLQAHVISNVIAVIFDIIPCGSGDLVYSSIRLAFFLPFSGSFTMLSCIPYIGDQLQ